ncbi:hypothetical protein B5X24_HaOG213499 [Helicoverpa armigera]|uniref:Uncharacterized protein n=1 Tax=Helicoverpa armigera TaxID=29058 RepID=A0A2W1BI94_HELAM|nr:hypothetical protein B5X24_HaOG213499 [Helicoverpa armigera]
MVFPLNSFVYGADGASIVANTERAHHSAEIQWVSRDGHMSPHWYYEKNYLPLAPSLGGRWNTGRSPPAYVPESHHR